MRYQVRLINHGAPLVVEATEFHPTGHGISFYSERMRPTGGNDQWGNPRRQRVRIPVAFFNNVESIVELPEEDQAAAEGFHEEMVTPLNRGGVFPVPTPWPQEPARWPELGTGVGAGVDQDGVNWNEARVE